LNSLYRGVARIIVLDVQTNSQMPVSHRNYCRGCPLKLVLPQRIRADVYVLDANPLPGGVLLIADVELDGVAPGLDIHLEIVVIARVDCFGWRPLMQHLS